jgi:protein-L-isoaspartate(D-aspartate) O-methyltransferase
LVLEAARTAMIDNQVRPSDVTDRRLIAAMAVIPREIFVAAGKQGIAYADLAVQTGEGRWLVPARDFAKLVQLAEVTEEDRVLDVAAGTGYSSAVLARLAGQVVALEEAGQAEALKQGLAKAGVEGVDVVAGPLKAGAPGKGPFNAIIVNGAVEVVPAAWLDQLAEGGRLAVPVIENGVAKARIYMKAGGKTSWRTPFESAASALPGFERTAEFRF